MPAWLAFLRQMKDNLGGGENASAQMPHVLTLIRHFESILVSGVRTCSPRMNDSCRR